jgi:pimeloyl-ACP methyl ester carboxylesterase
MPFLALLGAAVVLTPCRIEHPSRSIAWPAECGSLSVPENPLKPGGRQILLHLARVPAVSRRKQADPIFLLAGGPGMAATVMYAGVAPVFSRIGRDRDIVLLDQRGTGSSNALNCSLGDSDDSDDDPARVAPLARACLESLQAKADVTQYTTSIAVQDLDRVRAALGYQRINLYGASFGTRVAQHYLRRYPQHVRSMILDGVVAPTEIVGPDVALDAEAALSQVLARCVADPRCHAKFPDPAADYLRLRAQLSKAPAQLQVVDPTSGEPRALQFGLPQLGAVLRLQIYTSQTAALLPVALHAAATRGDYAALAGQYLMTTRDVAESLAYGMHNSVMCSEDIPFLDDSRIDRQRLRATFIGSKFLDGLRAICSVWPRGPVDADFHAPLATATPILLLSGGADPVTPPPYAALAAAQFTNARQLTLPGMGHGQLREPCMDKIMADFIRDATPATLDTRCIDAARPAPFFISPNGPAP